MMDPKPEDPPGVDVNAVDEYVRDIPFPTSKGHMVTRARDAGAPAAVVDALEALPGERYEAPPQVYQDLLHPNVDSAGRGRRVGGGSDQA